MPRSIRRHALALALLCIPFVPAGAHGSPGQTGFAFLKLGVGARAMGMGSAYVALADDPTAIYWNPAGLAGAEGAQVTATHNEWIQDFRHEFAAVSSPIGRGAVGLGMSGFYTSELEKRDDTGLLTGHFGFNDIAVSGGYAYRFSRWVSGGVAVKFIREMIDQEDATAVAFDLGGRYAIEETGITLGGAVQNMGGDTKFVAQSFALPRTFRAGAAVSRPIPSWKGKGSLSAEVRKSRGDRVRLHLGGELELKERLALRAGVKFRYDDEDLSFGIGLIRSRLRFDYALVPLSSDLGTTHFFSLSARL